jgi:hypothetical protein
MNRLIKQSWKCVRLVNRKYVHLPNAFFLILHSAVIINLIYCIKEPSFINNTLYTARKWCISLNIRTKYFKHFAMRLRIMWCWSTSSLCTEPFLRKTAKIDLSYLQRNSYTGHVLNSFHNFQCRHPIPNLNEIRQIILEMKHRVRLERPANYAHFFAQFMHGRNKTPKHSVPSH